MVDLVGRQTGLGSAGQLGNYSLNWLPHVSHDGLKSMWPAIFPSFDGFTAGSVASSVFNFWTILEILVLLATVANLKSFPLVYHVRLLNAFRFVLKSQRAKKALTPSQLFQPIITSSRNSLSETDIWMHKSNSSYFSDHDIARAHLVCTLFSEGIEKIRGGTAALVDGKMSPFALALRAVSCSFRKEIKPYEQYEMWTRLLTWDQKWVYIVTYFLRKNAAEPKGITLYPFQRSASRSRRSSLVNDQFLTKDSQKKSVIYASALSKCVFKNDHVTIAPAVMLEASGLLPKKPESAPLSNDDSSDQMAEVLPGSSTEQVPFYATDLVDSGHNPTAKNTQFVEPSKTSSTTENNIDFFPNDSSERPGRRPSGDWTYNAIEAERLRGLEIAKHLAKQEALESHFNSDTDALGRHTDGTGITGVVNMLAQLGKLSKTQFL